MGNKKITLFDERLKMNEEFKVHILNGDGIFEAKALAQKFDMLLDGLALGNNRYASIVKTKLEEACFFAKKELASRPEYQK